MQREGLKSRYKEIFLFDFPGTVCYDKQVNFRKVQIHAASRSVAEWYSVTMRITVAGESRK